MKHLALLQITSIKVDLKTKNIDFINLTNFADIKIIMFKFVGLIKSVF